MNALKSLTEIHLCIMPNRMGFVSKAENLLKRSGFEHFGFSRLETPLSMAVYDEWLQKGHHGSMRYLENHRDAKASPISHFKRAKSAIVVAKPYFPHPYAHGERPLSALRTALYAQGDDYHLAFKAELEAVIEGLKVDFPDDEFLCFTDSGPILERDLAYRAGLGWVGKNTCLIHNRHGSLFFLGQILTSVSFDESPAQRVADACGNCQRCLDICPTGALEKPRWLNANKCIAYWTIEAKLPAPRALSEKFADWFFGCDLCQTVCPWNEKKHGRELLQNLSKTSVTLITEELLADLHWLLTASNREIRKKLARSPMLRSGPAGLKRNALVVIGHLRIQDLRPEVESCLQVEALKDIAQKTLAQLN